MSSNTKIILASGSPRRLKLLSYLHLPFEVIVSNIDEVVADGTHPKDTVLKLAVDKAAAVAEKLDAKSEYVVLGADTIVVIDDQVLGKPEDQNHARQMLTQLSGRVHEVYTGVALVCLPSKTIFKDFGVSKVKFKNLSVTEIESCIVNGEIMDKAGAYALQGMAAAFIESIDGCFSNIIGLPLTVTTNLFRQAGIPIFGQLDSGN